jgi:hypothetical protein
MDNKKSLLDNTVALDVLAILKQELSNLGCKLRDYYIRFTTAGFDITDIKIDVNDPRQIIDVLKEAEPLVRHHFHKAPSKYAMMAANVEVSRRVDAELGLDYKAVGYENADRVSLSVSEPVAEKPLPPSEITPTDIAGGMGAEPDFSGEAEPGEEPGLEDVEAAVGGGGGGGGMGGGLGGITPLPVGGAAAAAGETGEGGEEDLLPGEEPGSPGAEFPEAPEYEEGPPEGEEGAPAPKPGKKMKKPGREY